MAPTTQHPLDGILTSHPTIHKIAESHFNDATTINMKWDCFEYLHPNHRLPQRHPAAIGKKGNNKQER